MDEDSKYVRGFLAGWNAKEASYKAAQRARQLAGIAKAKAAGKYRGRTPTAALKAPDVMRLRAEGKSTAEICAELGMCQASYYRIVRLHRDG